jgi:hypothetical protein
MMNPDAMPGFLQPPWFFEYFARFLIGVTSLLAYVSGWTALAQRFRSDGAIEGERFRFASGSMGRRWKQVTYGNCLFVTVNATLLPYKDGNHGVPPLLLTRKRHESRLRRGDVDKFGQKCVVFQQIHYAANFFRSVHGWMFGSHATFFACVSDDSVSGQK